MTDRIDLGPISDQPKRFIEFEGLKCEESSANPAWICLGTFDALAKAMAEITITSKSRKSLLGRWVNFVLVMISIWRKDSKSRRITAETPVAQQIELRAKRPGQRGIMLS